MSGEEPGIISELVAPGVRLLTLNRPDSLNAITWQMLAELHCALQDVERDESCRVLVITGAGRGFCSGLDLRSADDPLGTGDGVEAFLKRQEQLGELAARLTELRIPVIAAVNGPAAGGGLAIALASDVRVCSPAARFNAAFVRLGLSACDVGVSYLLPRIVGLGLASELMLTGRFVGADEAAQVGLVSRVVPADALMDEAFRIAGEIADNAPFAVRMTKEVLMANVDSPSLRAAVKLENRTQTIASLTPGHREALEAFLERRTPSFDRT